MPGLEKCSHIFENGICIKCGNQIISSGEKLDMVNHPPHYKSKNGLEVINVIEDFELNYNLGNAVKYILRHNKKSDPITDLKKAAWYLNREIENRDK